MVAFQRRQLLSCPFFIRHEGMILREIWDFVVVRWLFAFLYHRWRHCRSSVIARSSGDFVQGCEEAISSGTETYQCSHERLLPRPTRSGSAAPRNDGAPAQRFSTWLITFRSSPWCSVAHYADLINCYKKTAIILTSSHQGDAINFSSDWKYFFVKNNGVFQEEKKESDIDIVCEKMDASKEMDLFWKRKLPVFRGRGIIFYLMKTRSILVDKKMKLTVWRADNLSH